MAKHKTQFHQRKIPMRKDVVSGQMMPKKDLLRIVKTNSDLLQLDPSGKVNGHGAYIGIDVTLAKKAKAEKILDIVFEMPVPEDFYDHLIDWVDHQQARKELFSHEQIIKEKNS